ncbi:alanine racemase [Rhodocista pekingensis]|uniref:Alanine racemase n=1 Tax=Rhodocista pekingensis TaxID=201185 RepID=A0ABW2KYU2_9PROT
MTDPVIPALDGVPSRAGAVLAIDLGALAANWRDLAARVAPAECGAVVKADAYGLGAGPVARRLLSEGARTFFVADTEAGMALRAVLPEPRIVVLHGVPPGAAPDLAAARLLPALNTPGDLERWRAEGQRRGAPLPCFVHIDTGMNRLGLTAAELETLAGDADRLLAGVRVESWMSHLACADHPADPMTKTQLGRFRAALARLPAARASLANSAGIFHGRDYHFDLVRPGIALYGPNPAPWTENPMRPVVRVFARIHQVRPVWPDDTVGYDATHRIGRPGRIAALGMGYADGYPWSLSGRGEVLFGGAHRAPLVGRVSMDLLTADVTDVPERFLAEGGWAEVIGPHRPVDAAAAEAGTIGYEVLTRLGSRYHRVHLDGPGG